MPLRSRNLRDWAYPLIYPGTSCTRVLVIGDSHAAQNYGATTGRWYNGICRTWPVTITGMMMAGNDNVFCTSLDSGTGGTVTALQIGATQHPTDGSICPYAVNATTWAGATASDSLIRRDDLLSTMARFRGGNPYLSNAMTVKIGWWRRSNSLTTARMRAGYTDDSYTTDTSNIDLSTGGGAAGYASRTMAIASHASKLQRWDMFTGSENETGKEFTPLGVRFERTNPTGGCSFVFVGNGGTRAADYADTTTICSDAALAGFMSLWGPFDRILWVLGTNMTAGESGDITGVWKANMVAAHRRWANASAAAGKAPMGLFITGHDSNITSRLANMAAAIDSASESNNDIAHVDTAAALPNYTETNATYLEDGVHFNIAGSLAVPNALGMAMQSAVDVSPVTMRVTRNWR